MKKLNLFLTAIILIFIITGCGNSKPNNELLQENQEIQTTDDSSATTEVRKCAVCGRVLSPAYKYNNCDWCTCQKNGCYMPIKDKSSNYCITHECTKDGCTSERISGSEYCVRHQ